MSEEQIELSVEHRTSALDRRLMRGAITQAEAKRAAERVDRQRAEAVRRAAPELLAAVQALLAVFPDPILQDGCRLRQSEVAGLNGAIEAANLAIAKAEGR